MSVIEEIAQELSGTYPDPKDLRSKLDIGLQTALLSSMYDIVSPSVSTPLYNKGRDNGRAVLEELDGCYTIEEEGYREIDSLDLLSRMFLCSVNPLLEGKTGGGKTHLLEEIAKTVLPKESYAISRLSGSALTNNLLEPYIFVDQASGYPELKINEEACKGMLIHIADEFNRAPGQQALQLGEHVIYINGEFMEIGVLVQELDDDLNLVDTSRFKPLWFATAQNPPQNEDSVYLATAQNDTAVVGRLNKLQYKNPAVSAGVTTTLTTSENAHHERFLENFKGRINSIFGTDLSTEQIEEDYLSLLAFATDPKRLKQEYISTSSEFMDLFITTNARRRDRKDLTLEDNVNLWNGLVAKWGKKLDDKYGSKFKEYNLKFQTDAETGEIEKVTKGMREPVNMRDSARLKTLTDMFYYSDIFGEIDPEDPLTYNFQRPAFIDVYDVAHAAIFLSDSKKMGKDTSNPQLAVNTLLTAYTNLINDQFDSIGGPFKDKKFSSENTEAGLKYISFQNAARNAFSSNISNNETPTKNMISNLSDEVTRVVNKADNNVKKFIASRNASVLSGFCGFLAEFDDEHDQLFEVLKNKEAKRAKKAKQKPSFARFFGSYVDELTDLYQEKSHTKGLKNLKARFTHTVPQVLVGCKV